MGGWKPPAVMEGVYTKARSEKVVTEMRAAATKACAGLEVERFVRYLGRDVCVEASEALGTEQGAEARIWCRRFRSARDQLAPSAVLPIREDFWFLMGRRARTLKLSTHQITEVSSVAPSFRAEPKKYRSVETNNGVRTREREAAVSSAPSKQVRRD